MLDKQTILNSLSPNQLFLEWQDCSYVMALCHDEVRKNLSLYLAIKLKNYADDLVKLGVVDSYKRFYDIHNQVALRGHVNMIVEFCKSNGVEIVMGDNIKLISKHHPSYDPSFIRSLKISKKGNMIQLRSYQLEMADWCLKHRLGVGISATGSGKTMVLYAMCRYLINEKPTTKIVIIVPNATLVDQGYSDFEEYSSLDDEWDSLSHCERMKGGMKPSFEKNILFTTWQSLKNIRKDFYETFNHIFVDEVHGADADVLKNTILKCKNAYTKIGMTGSLKGTGKMINTESQMTLKGLFARIETFSTAPMLMDLGVLPKLKMILLRVVYSSNVRKHLKKMSEVDKNKALDRSDHLKLFKEEQDLLLGITERKEMLSKLIDGFGGSGVAFFNNIERMEETQKHYSEVFKGRKKSGIIYGGTKDDTRKDILYTQLEDKTQEYQLFSTLRTTSTGISVDNIRYGLLADSTKARVTVLQSIGRLLRGDEAILIDIEDDIDNRKGFLSRHAKERRELYESCGYPFEEKTLYLEVNSISELDNYQLM